MAKQKAKVPMRVINPMSAHIYGVNYKRNLTVSMDAAVAKKAEENGDAVPLKIKQKPKKKTPPTV